MNRTPRRARAQRAWTGPLERKLRDAHGAASHRWVSRPLYGDLGRIFLGDDPDAEFAGGAAGRR